MSGHLPECYKENSTDSCICSELRACEQRVLHAALEAVINCDDYRSSANMLLVDAYREGLNAAREAIDALREEHK